VIRIGNKDKKLSKEGIISPTEASSKAVRALRLFVALPLYAGSFVQRERATIEKALPDLLHR
jgi:hypothetical protein